MLFQSTTAEGPPAMSHVGALVVVEADPASDALFKAVCAIATCASHRDKPTAIRRLGYWKAQQGGERRRVASEKFDEDEMASGQKRN